MKVGVLTGGFDPITAGHLSLFEDAKSRVDVLVVFANSDEWLTRKKGKPFMDQSHRLKILNAIENIDRAWPLQCNEDKDNSSCMAIEIVCQLYPGHEILFMNGGDREKDNIPEMSLLGEHPNLEFVFGVGGSNKDYSSSWLLRDWVENTVERSWGYYKVLSDQTYYKVKELVINPGKSISLQKHLYRSEYWVVVSGEADCECDDESFNMRKGENTIIREGEVHKITNNQDEHLVIVEVQMGDKCVEDDIIRYD